MHTERIRTHIIPDGGLADIIADIIILEDIVVIAQSIRAILRHTQLMMILRWTKTIQIVMIHIPAVCDRQVPVPVLLPVEEQAAVNKI